MESKLYFPDNNEYISSNLYLFINISGITVIIEEYSSDHVLQYIGGKNK